MKHIQHTGFTLVEMIAVLAIFSIMTSIVLFNYNKFTSDTVLTNMAYEVALSVREAQIYGVSVRNPDGVSGEDFSKPYGIHFPKVTGGSSSYFLFADAESTPNGTYAGSTCTPGSGECVQAYTLQRNVKITDMRAGPDCSEPLTNGQSLSVSFRRPNPEPLFNGAKDKTFAEITLTAPDGATRYVVVSNNGQIYVNNESACFAI